MNLKGKTVLLSFDLEEFDMPFEYGMKIDFNDQIERSIEGTGIILDLLHRHQIQATFFSTAVFAANTVDLIRKICRAGHELASHGFYHSKFQPEDLRESKLALEKISRSDVLGFRMARMMPVNDRDIMQAGYRYNSSLNPTFLPGRYNNFFRPRTLFKTENLFQIPASATPGIRLPLFWLSFHNLPLWCYKLACKATMRTDTYLNLYFHPWEFIEINRPEYGLPDYVTKNSGAEMIYRFDNLLRWMKDEDYKFNTFSNFLDL